VESFGQVGVLRRPFFDRTNGGKQGKKRTHSAAKQHRFGLFFYEKWMKRRYFGQNAPFHLKEKGSKNVSKSKSVFNL